MLLSRKARRVWLTLAERKLSLFCRRRSWKLEVGRQHLDLMALAGSGEKLNHCYEDSRLWLHSRTRMRPDGSAHSNDVFRKSLPSLFVLQYDTFLLLYDRRFWKSLSDAYVMSDANWRNLYLISKCFWSKGAPKNKDKMTTLKVDSKMGKLRNNPISQWQWLLPFDDPDICCFEGPNGARWTSLCSDGRI